MNHEQGNEMRYVLKGELQIQAARQRLERLIDKGATVDLVEKQKPRTNPQNAWYWYCICSLGLEMGYTKDEMHIAAKRELKFWYEKDGQRFLRSTASLAVAEMSDYIERLRSWAEALGYPLPSADQYHAHRQDLDEYIDANSHRLKSDV
jgi:hypothetical protein